MTNEEYEDKTSENEALETNDADYGEDDSSTARESSEDDGEVTLTRAELDERIKAARKEQDRRWRERIKKASDSDDDGKESRRESKESSQVDERYERLELKVEGIKEKDKQDFILDYARLKKISVQEALSSSVVKAELREMDEAKQQRDATPRSSNRTAQPRTDDVTYWARQLTEKGKSAPTAEMRRKVRHYLAEQ